MQELTTSWLKYLAQERGYSPHTIEAYRNDIEAYRIFLRSYNAGEPSLDDLLAADLRLIRSFLASRKTKDYSNTSSARTLSGIKSFYKFLHYSTGKTSEVIFSARSPKKPKPLPKALTKDDTFASLNNIENFAKDDWQGLRDRALLMLIYASGMRISEALSITKAHLHDGHIRILGKGNKERLIPWIPAAKALVEQYLQKVPYDIEDGVIFLSERGKPLARATFAKQLRNMRRREGLPEYLTPHAFRHSFATHLLENGADLKAIQELLGHASLSTTQRYTKVDLNRLASVYKDAHPLQ